MTTVATGKASRDVDEYADVLAMFTELQRTCGHPGHAARQRERIISRCLDLADRIARHYGGRGEDMEDLTQVARLGLVKAVDRFDPAMGSNFVAFAVPTMMGEVRRHFRDTGWSMHVPRRLKDRHATMTRARTELMQSLGRAPTASQLAKHLDLSREDVVESLLAADAYRGIRSTRPSPAAIRHHGWSPTPSATSTLRSTSSPTGRRSARCSRPYRGGSAACSTCASSSP